MGSSFSTTSATSHSSKPMDLELLSRLLSDAPEDIARIIFEFAAQNDRPTAAAIALVSKQTNAWITPILYRTVLLKTVSQVETFNELMKYEQTRNSVPKPKRLGCTAALVLLSESGSVPNPQLMSKSCPELRQLHIHQDISYDIQKYEVFPEQLRQLVVCGWVMHRTYRSMPMYSILTHLAFVHDVPADEYFPGNPSVSFPCLTHFACGYRVYGERAERPYVSASLVTEDLAIILGRVLTVPSLRLAVVLVQDFSRENVLTEQDMRILLADVPQKDDSRVVLFARDPRENNQHLDMINVDSWYTNHDDSFWSLAERVIQNR